MGDRGYEVYRCKNRYFVYFHESDSDPSILGLQILDTIPRGVSKEEFEEWVRSNQKDFDARYEELKDLYLGDYREDMPSEYVTDEQPYTDLFIEWIYEIDLDNLVFHINRHPLFRLDNMPPEDVFLKSISFDHFGHLALHENTPIEFRYNWRAPPPPPPPESLIAYNSYPNQSSTSSVHELLRVPMAFSSIERARTTLVEVLVAQRMTRYDAARSVRILESAPNRDYISLGMLKEAMSLVNFAVGPPIPSLPCYSCCNTLDFIWIRKDVCLRITTHLDDEGNLQASIGDLVHHINLTQDKVGTVYGVACSIFHCAIVRLDKVGQQGTSFAHTPALQFLPSFYATEMSTPGIEALSRLGCQSSGVEFLTAISEAYNIPHITLKESLGTRPFVVKVPVEVWMNVGHFITSPKDLVSLASISPRAMSAAADLARYPWVLEFRLVDVVGSVSPGPETTESAEESDVQKGYSHLGSAKFIVVKGGRPINVELGDQSRRRRMLGRMPFIVETFHRNLQYSLHVSELDEDKANT